MDSRLRTFVKAVTWQVLGLFTTTLIVWLASGSMVAALGAAGGTAACSFVCYILHERAWARVRWGRGPNS